MTDTFDWSVDNLYTQTVTVNGTEVFDSSRNANINSLSIGGNEVVDSSRNATFNALDDTPFGQSTPAALNGNVTSTGSTTARDLEDRFADVVNVKDFGAVGDGSTDDTSAIQGALDAGDIIYIPDGDYLITAELAPVSDTLIYGVGKTSRIFTTTDNLNIFKADSQQRVVFRRVLIEGNNTSTASSDGNGIYFLNCDDCEVSDCYFQNVGGHTILVNGNEATRHEKFRIYRNHLIDNAAGRTGTREIYFLGNLGDFNADHNVITADGSSPKDRGISVANNGSSLQWVEFRARYNRITGHALTGISTTGEDAAAAFTTGIVDVAQNYIENVGSQGIKLKHPRRVNVSYNYLDGNDTSPENPGTLQGTIHLQWAEECTCHGNIVRNAGTDGIRIVGQPASSGGDTDGVGRESWSVADNIISGPAEAGIYVNEHVYDTVVSGNIITDGSEHGIEVFEDGNGDEPKRLVISNNVIRTMASQGMRIINAFEVLLNSNSVVESGQNGVNVGTATNVVVNGGLYLDNGTALGGSGSQAGLRFGSITNLTLTGVRSGSENGTSQEYGLSFASGNADFLITGCNLRDNQTAGIESPGNMPNGALVRDNLGWTTRNSGSDSIASGSTSVTVSHGLDVTPSLQDISIIGGEDPTNSVGAIWVNSITSTQFTVNVENDPGSSGWDFGWRVDV